MSELLRDNEERSSIRSLFDRALDELSAHGVAIFGGFYYEDSNARAKTEVNSIFINEKYLKIQKDEMERVLVHEIQHAINRFRQHQLSEEESRYVYAFVLHPLFRDIHSRMRKFYTEKLKGGYQFYKNVNELPSRFREIGVSNDYTHPDEFLALLQGYKKYIEQISRNISVSIYPYEFIEAFEPGDLRLLDENYRVILAKDLLKNDPHILDPLQDFPLHITEDDLKDI